MKTLRQRLLKANLVRLTAAQSTGKNSAIFDFDEIDVDTNEVVNVGRAACFDVDLLEQHVTEDNILTGIARLANDKCTINLSKAFDKTGLGIRR